MNNDFPRILTLLRKERHISQKQAAADLGVSQALLSHYEKGIRECSLDFIVRTADYYGVSCDYLLGKTQIRDTASPTVTTEPDAENILNSIHIVFAILKKINSKSLAHQITVYLDCAVYNAFRAIVKATHVKPALFKTEGELSEVLTECRMRLSLARIRSLLDSPETENEDGAELTDKLPEDYPELAPSLFALIEAVESEHKTI